MEVGSEINAIASYLEKHLDEETIPDVQAALVMTNEKCEVDADNAPAPTLEVKKLKDFIRKTAKGKPISLDVVKEIQNAFNKED